MRNPLRILLAEDLTIVRQGLRLLIDSQPDMDVVGETADGVAVVQQANELRPDIVVMDISMPRMNGLVATKMLKRVQPNVVVLALTRHDDSTYFEELLRAGASGYVLKQSAPSELLKAIRAVAAGGVYLDATFGARPAEDVKLVAAMVQRALATREPDALHFERSTLLGQEAALNIHAVPLARGDPPAPCAYSITLRPGSAA